MNRRLELVRQRRDLLITRADLQRFDLEVQVAPWKKSLHYIDYGVRFVRRAREHPAAVALTLVAVFVLGRHRLGRVTSLALSAWRVYQVFARSKASPVQR